MSLTTYFLETVAPTNESLQVYSGWSTDLGLARRTKIAYVTIGFFGIIDNAFVVTLMIVHRKLFLKRVPNLFILNQSILDMLVAVWLLAVNAAELAVLETGYDYTVPGAELLCRLWANSLPLWSFFVCSTYNMLALTTERYLQIVHPLYHKANFTRQKAYCMLGAVWFIGPAYNLILGVPTSGIVNGNCEKTNQFPSMAVEQAVGIIHVMVLYFLPLIMLAYLYGRMIWVIRRQARVHPGATGSGGGDSRMNRAQRNLMKTVALVTAFFVVCWSCNQFFFLLAKSGYSVDWSGTFYHFSVIMVFLNCCVNPFVYILKYKDFQDVLKRSFCPKRQQVQDVTATNAGSSTQRTGLNPPGPRKY